MAADAADLERRVMAAVKASAARGDPPLLQAAEASRCAREAAASASASASCGLALAEALVANLCFAHNTGAMWKLLDQAMSSRLVHPLHTLALLTPRYPSDSILASPFPVSVAQFVFRYSSLSDAKLPYVVLVCVLLLCRVVPNRREQPEAYRLYLELLGRYAVAPVYPECTERKSM